MHHVFGSSALCRGEIKRLTFQAMSRKGQAECKMSGNPGLIWNVGCELLFLHFLRLPNDSSDLGTCYCHSQSPLFPLSSNKNCHLDKSFFPEKYQAGI